MQFRGDAPYVLVVLTPGAQTVIDLDEPGWVERYAHLMRVPGRWILARKDTNTPVFLMVVRDGEEPYYTSRVLGSMLLPPPDALGMSQDDLTATNARSQVRAYGLGKKRLDGHVDRVWILPNGVVCGGDDVDEIGSEMARTKLHALLRSKRRGPDDGRQRSGSEEQGPEAQGLREVEGEVV